MWARKRLDISWSDIAAGLMANLRPAGARRRAELAARVEAAAGVSAPSGANPIAENAATRTSHDTACACLSVRTGFDLLWQALALPAGSEVIFSALTIHDMPRIAAEHGLVPVPADINLSTLGPTKETLERALTPNTRALVVAHLCGARLDLTPCVEFARANNLLLIEDCAQAYDGLDFRGDPRAAVSMFSFGTIKTATACGGAVLQIRDPELRAAVQQRQAAYPVAGRGWFFARLMKNSLMKAVTLRPWYGLLIAACRLLGKDYDHVINGSVRGFPGPEFFHRIRQQPPAGLLALLLRRLTHYRTARLEVRTSLGRRLAAHLNQVCDCPAAASAEHNYWVFPVLAPDASALIGKLRQAGFDATQGQSLCAVAAPPGRENLAPLQAQRFLREVVFLPVYPDLPEEAIDRMADALPHSVPAPAAAGLHPSPAH